LMQAFKIMWTCEERDSEVAVTNVFSAVTKRIANIGVPNGGENFFKSKGRVEGAAAPMRRGLGTKGSLQQELS